jgi:amphi-Trp domain-containing protein
MGREVVLFKSEERKDLQEVVAFLHELADKLAGNRLTLHQGQETLHLDIPNNVVLELKVEEEEKGTSTKRSLEVEIEWKEGEPEGFHLGD